MLSSAVLALILACGGGETAEKTAAPPPADPEVEADAKKEEPKEEPKEEADDGNQVEKISRTFRVPAAEKATIKTRARTEIIEQAKKAGFDRAVDVEITKEECDDRVCTVTVTANAIKEAAAAEGAEGEGADNACNPCAGGEEEKAEGAENPCAAGEEEAGEGGE